MSSPVKGLAIKNVFLLTIVVLLISFPLVARHNADFRGTDDQAEKVVLEMRPGYEPWFSSVWNPPAGEMQSLLFALQAAIGSGIVCYYLGYVRGRKKGQEERVKDVKH